MKVTHNIPKPQRVSIAHMKPGQIGTTDEGHVYYRTYRCAACLTNPGRSYSGNADAATQVYVTLAPTGTVFTLEVTDDATDDE